MLKEKIKMTNEIVTDNKIIIENEHTLFCKKERIIFPNISELEKEVKQIRKELKQQGVKLYRTDTLKTLKDKKEEYNKMVEEYNNTFDFLVKSWKEKLEQGGMYTGYSDDEFFNNILKPTEWKLEKMLYQNTILSKIKEIEIKVKEVKNELEHGTQFIGVAI